jgi:hypothetical protein
VTTKYLIDTLNPTGYSQVMDELVSGAVTKTYTYGRQRISENQLSGSTWTPTFYGYDGHGRVAHIWVPHFSRSLIARIRSKERIHFCGAKLKASTRT